MFCRNLVMPRKRNWRMALVKMRNQSHASNDSRLVDSSHVKNSTKDSTIDVTVDRPLRLVDTSHVKNSTEDRGDTASLKRVLDLPSGTNNITNLPSGTSNIANLPLGTMNSTNMSSGSLKCDSLPSRTTISNTFMEKNLSVTRLFGTINQASDLFPAFSRGVQCTCIALMSIVLQNASTSAELDEVLFAGDNLYRVRIAELQSTVQFVSKMLQFQELPKFVDVHEHQYEICYFEQIYGTVTHIDWNQSCQSNNLNLKEGIELSFIGYSQGLIIVGGICSAIYMDDKSCPVFFDSHSHGKDGLSCTDRRL